MTQTVKLTPAMRSVLAIMLAGKSPYHGASGMRQRGPRRNLLERMRADGLIKRGDVISGMWLQITDAGRAALATAKE